MTAKLLDGVYYVTGHAAAESQATVFVPGSDGKVILRGLEDDTYVATELETDEGYNLLKSSITVVISAVEGEACPDCHRLLLTASATVNDKAVEMKEDNVELIPSPLNHSHALRRYYGNMLCKASVVVSPGVMNLFGFFKLIEKYGVNSIDLVPTALSILLKLSKNKLGEYKDTLRYIELGAAPLMQADKDRLKALLPHTRLYNFYGSTESGCIAIYNFND